MTETPRTTISSQAPIGIVAGGGGVIAELLQVLTAHDAPFFVAAIKGEYDQGREDERIKEFSWGQIGRLVKYFRQHQCRQLLLIGRITRRPDFLSIIGDPGTILRVPKIAAAIARGGDDRVLRRIIDLIEGEGFSVIGLQDVAPELLAPVGVFTKQRPASEQSRDLPIALNLLHHLSSHDVGQAVVLHKGRVWAIEGAEGTDAMLSRIADLRRAERITTKLHTGILVKTTKIGQDLRVDLPTVGSQTVERAIQAGLAGIYVEAGKVITAERKEMIQLANQASLFIEGIETNEH